MSTVETTRCPACAVELPLTASHKLHGRYVCVEGSSAGAPHRFVVITNALQEVAECDDVEDATQAAAFLSSEQGRQLFAVELSVLLDRRDRLEALRRRLDRTRDGIAAARLAGGMAALGSLDPANDAVIRLLEDLTEEASVWQA